MDDMAIKSKNDNYFLQEITETFANLRSANMKLNPQKCIFGRKKENSLDMSSQRKE